jgi:hypothetical protein
MYTKENFLNTVTHEFAVIKHLAEKVPPHTEGYKPTENQRTTLELLQYVSVVFGVATKAIVTGDMSVFGTDMPASASTTFENFSEMMDMQDTLIKKLVSPMTEEEMAVTMNMFNQGEKPKGVYLIESVLKWIVAYKMQLFLYIKASGNSNIGTSNLWAGVDMPPQS